MPLLRIREREGLKRAITRSHPLGSHQDTCKSAVERAMTSRADCALKTRRSAMRPTKCRHRSPHKNARRNTCQVHIHFPFTLRQFSHSVVLSRFSCPTRLEVRTHNSRILACVCRARDDDTSVQIEFFGFEDGCVSCRSWFETRSRLECWRRSCAKAKSRNIARRHNVRSSSASFSQYRLLSRSFFL